MNGLFDLYLHAMYYRKGLEWKRAWSDVFLNTHSNVFQVFLVWKDCFQKDKCEKVDMCHLMQEDKVKPKHSEGKDTVPWDGWGMEGDAPSTIFSGTALLTVDANRDVTVSTGQPPLGFLNRFDIHLCILSNSWGGGKTLNPDWMHHQDWIIPKVNRIQVFQKATGPATTFHAVDFCHL